MSISKPTAEELAAWEKRLSEESLSMRRGESSRLVYSHRDDNRLTESSWSKAKAWVKSAHKKYALICGICGEGFVSGRADAKCCPRPKSCRRELQSRADKSAHR